jgi:hypothetical protein
VLLVPVDGGLTLGTFDIVEVLRQINAPLMVPMHFFGSSTLNRFLGQAKAHFEVEYSTTPAISLSRDTLPKTPTVRVLPGH